MKKISKIALASCMISYMTLGPVLADNSPVLRSTVEKAVPSISLKDDVKIDKYNRLISISLRDSDLRQVLRMLADRAGMNIVLDDSVSGKVSLDLVNSTINKAFQYIFQLNKLNYSLDGNTLVVATAEKINELGLNRTQMKPIKVRYYEADIVAKFLNTNVFATNRPGSNGAFPSIVTNPKTNEIIIFGNSNDVAIAQKVVDYIDIKPVTKSFNVNYRNVKSLAGMICKTVYNIEDTGILAASGGSGTSSTSTSTSSSTSTQATGTTGTSSTDTESLNPNDAGATVICGTKLAATTGKFQSLDVNAFSIITDPVLNQITVYGGTQDQLFQTEEFIKKFDRKEPQAYVEISVIELNNSGSKALSNLSQSMHLDLSLKKGMVYPRALAPTIKVLVDQKKGRVLANPRIIATNNQLTKVDLTEDYVRTVKTEYLTGISQTPISQKTYEIADAGINIELTPRINPNGYVILDLKPTYSSIANRITNPDNNDIGATLLNRRNMEFKNLRIKDGETLVLGGFIKESETNSTSKIPLIADIPILGTFFKTIGIEKTRTELIIMITPKIIKEADQVNSI